MANHNPTIFIRKLVQIIETSLDPRRRIVNRDVACLLLFQPFNLCFRFLTRRHALLLDTLNVSIHFFPRCLQSSAFSRITPCQLSTLSTSNRGCIIHDSGGNTLPSPGDDPRRQGIGFHQSFILCPKEWRGSVLSNFRGDRKFFEFEFVAFFGRVIIII